MKKDSPPEQNCTLPISVFYKSTNFLGFNGLGVQIQWTCCCIRLVLLLLHAGKALKVKSCERLERKCRKHSDEFNPLLTGDLLKLSCKPTVRLTRPHLPRSEDIRIDDSSRFFPVGFSMCFTQVPSGEKTPFFSAPAKLLDSRYQQH